MLGLAFCDDTLSILYFSWNVVVVVHVLHNVIRCFNLLGYFICQVLYYYDNYYQFSRSSLRTYALNKRRMRLRFEDLLLQKHLIIKEILQRFSPSDFFLSSWDLCSIGFFIRTTIWLLQLVHCFCKKWLVPSKNATNMCQYSDPHTRLFLYS